VPDRPAARAEREPLPFRPAAAGCCCCFSVHVHAGQWGTCDGRPAVTGVWTSPRHRERWQVFGLLRTQTGSLMTRSAATSDPSTKPGRRN
jgi:hypothetical protein